MSFTETTQSASSEDGLGPRIDPDSWSSETTTIAPAPWLLLATSEGNEDPTAVGPAPSGLLLELCRPDNDPPEPAAPARLHSEDTLEPVVTNSSPAPSWAAVTARSRWSWGVWVALIGGMLVSGGLLLPLSPGSPPPPEPQEVAPATVPEAPVAASPAICQPDVHVPPPVEAVSPAREGTKEAPRARPVRHKASKRHDHRRRLALLK